MVTRKRFSFFKQGLRSILFLCVLVHVLHVFAASKDAYQSHLKAYCDQEEKQFCDKLGLPRLGQFDVVLSCEEFYRENHCDEVKSALAKSVREQVMSCDPKDLCQKSAESFECVIDGVKLQLTWQNLLMLTASGAATGAALTAGGKTAAAIAGGIPGTLLFGAPFFLIEASKAEKECSTNTQYKALAIRIHNGSLLKREPKLNVDDPNLLKMPCSDLNTFLQRRLDTLASKRIDRQMWSLDAKPTSGSELSPEANTLLETLRSTKCFDRAVVNKKVCEAVTGIVFGSVVGGASAVAGGAMVAKATAAERAAVAASAARSTPEGLHASMMAGSSEAERVVKIGEALRARKIDPKTTHIPEFADDVDSYLAYAKKSIEGQNEDKRSRLKTLKDFEAEAKGKVKDGKVTYEWWNDFNYRLSILMTPASKRTTLSGGYPDALAVGLLKNDAWKTETGFRAVADSTEVSRFAEYSPERIAKSFPEYASVPSANGDVGIAALNSTYGSDTNLIGVLGARLRADGREMYPDHFIRHDHVHAGNNETVNRRYNVPKEARVKMREGYLAHRDTVPLEGDRRAAFEFGYYFMTHEVPAADYIVRKGGAYNSMPSEQNVKLVRDPDWYAGSVPVWATKSDAAAKKFLEQALAEVKNFSTKYFPVKDK